MASYEYEEAVDNLVSKSRGVASILLELGVARADDSEFGDVFDLLGDDLWQAVKAVDEAKGGEAA